MIPPHISVGVLRTVLSLCFSWSCNVDINTHIIISLSLSLILEWFFVMTRNIDYSVKLKDALSLMIHRVLLSIVLTFSCGLVPVSSKKLHLILPCKYILTWLYRSRGNLIQRHIISVFIKRGKGLHFPHCGTAQFVLVIQSSFYSISSLLRDFCLMFITAKCAPMPLS